MNSNDLMYYLKGFVELTNEPPNRDQWGVIRAKVLSTSIVEPFIVDAPPMHNPTSMGDVRPFIDQTKLPPLKGFLPNSNCGCGSWPSAGQSDVEGG